MRAVVDFIVAPPEHHRRHHVPHVERRAAAPVRAACPTRRCTPRTCGSTRRWARRAPSSRAIRRSPSIHEFRYHPKSVIGGTFDWIYEHLGLFSLGGRDLGADARGGHHRLQVHRLVSRPSDRGRPQALPLERGEARRRSRITAWQPFDHPQLGRVEIGGWNRFHAFGNPPLPLLEKELARFPRWLLWQALISPKLELVHAGATRLGGGSLEGHAGRAEHGLAAELRVASARWSARSCAA